MKQKMRVWAIRNDEISYYNIDSVENAIDIINDMANLDLLNDDIEWNAFGLEILSDTSEWEEWSDDDGFTVLEIRDRNFKDACETMVQMNKDKEQNNA